MFIYKDNKNSVKILNIAKFFIKNKKLLYTMYIVKISLTETNFVPQIIA